ncbi:restriction endonuclease subunit S [Shewanella algae]|uniref:restriction endonuclease subunit S n=1 Tax=Shewanella algae TaxID=38313 RepID=UPI001C593E61|nr:restriction endonuclease subunit S [Shewanella algae]HDS1213195.1 restriction endonuclease subunit S [Shewanella algae]
MSADWREVKLSELTSKITKGTTPSKKDGGFSDAGVNYIKAESVGYDGTIDETKFAFISENVHEKLKRSQLAPGDILYSMAGVFLGKSALVEERHIPANTNQALALIRPKHEEVDAKYLRYYLSQPSVVHFVNNATSQSAQPNINLKQIGDLNISLPSLERQRNISQVLSTLDQKISLNTQTNQTLEQMAQALFKSWFVDFDPVIDNALDSGFFEREFAGEDIPEPLAQRVAVRQAMRQSLREAGGTDAAAPVIGGLPPETRALFPDRFEKHPELGWIPKGWMVKSLAEQTKLIGGGTPKRSNEEFWGGGIPWFSVKDAPNNSDVFVLDTDEKITVAGLNGSSTRLLPVGTTIISARGTVGKLALVGREMAMNQSCYGVLPADGLGLGVYFNYFSLKRIVYWLRQNTHGAVFDTITKQTFETVSSVVPPSTIASEFERQVTPWLDLVKSKLLENVSLSQLRDTLLPKLLSGELTVLDVCQENQVESKVA